MDLVVRSSHVDGLTHPHLTLLDRRGVVGGERGLPLCVGDGEAREEAHLLLLFFAKLDALLPLALCACGRGGGSLLDLVLWVHREDEAVDGLEERVWELCADFVAFLLEAGKVFGLAVEVDEELGESRVCRGGGRVGRERGGSAREVGGGVSGEGATERGGW